MTKDNKHLSALGEPVATAWRKFDNWFFRECVFRERRHLYAMFALPLDEIRNHGHERHALRHIRKQLQGLEPTDRTLSLIARIEELVDIWDDADDVLITRFLRADSAERARCTVCSREAFHSKSIDHTKACFVGRVAVVLAALNGGGDGE